MKTETPTTSLNHSIRLLKAFADPVRLRLLNLLVGDREVCVCHLHEALVLPQPTVSRHLAHLRKLGLVAGRKEGLWVYYHISKPTGDLHRTLIGSLETCLADAEVLREDRKRLDRPLAVSGWDLLIRVLFFRRLYSFCSMYSNPKGDHDGRSRIEARHRDAVRCRR